MNNKKSVAKKRSNDKINAEIRFNLYCFDNLKIEIENLKQQLEEYRKMDFSSMKAQVITDMPICHTGASKTENMALERIDYIEKLEHEIDNKMRLYRSIDSVILFLKHNYMAILNNRYFDGMEWKVIAINNNISHTRCREIDRTIVSLIQAKLKNNGYKYNSKN
jgi:DNA-directed RNA polymerase specialized sigma subunit